MGGSQRDPSRRARRNQLESKCLRRAQRCSVREWVSFHRPGWPNFGRHRVCQGSSRSARDWSTSGETVGRVRAEFGRQSMAAQHRPAWDQSWPDLGQLGGPMSPANSRLAPARSGRCQATLGPRLRRKLSRTWPNLEGIGQSGPGPTGVGQTSAEFGRFGPSSSEAGRSPTTSGQIWGKLCRWHRPKEARKLQTEPRLRSALGRCWQTWATKVLDQAWADFVGFWGADVAAVPWVAAAPWADPATALSGVISCRKVGKTERAKTCDGGVVNSVALPSGRPAGSTRVRRRTGNDTWGIRWPKLADVGQLLANLGHPPPSAGQIWSRSGQI